MQVTVKHLRPFGPGIMNTQIPENIVKNLNDYIDKIIADKAKAQKLDYGENLAGDVTQEFLIENEVSKSTGWLEFLANGTKHYIKENTGKDVKKFILLKSWVVRQFENEYNPIHWHSGHISGAGFLKLPNSFGDSKQKKRNRQYVGGRLDLIHGSRMFMSPSIYSIQPKVGDFYFFPNYLMHTVYPFKDTKEERRSISFNASVDGEIYNVYS